MSDKKSNDEKSLIQSLIFLTQAFKHVDDELKYIIDEFGNDSEIYILESLFEVNPLESI